MKSRFLSFIAILSLLCLPFINCSFQASLFTKMNKNYAKKNLIISPLSIYQILSLTTNGAKSTTQEEMLKALESESISKLNQVNYDILDIFKGFSTVEMANGIMTTFTPLQSFIDISEKYLAPYQPLVSPNQVNEWVSEKTHGKIKKILEELEPNTEMVLLNAVYFKGQWINKFNSERTMKKPFYNYNDEEKVKEVDTMKIEQSFKYYEDSDIQAIELPYEKESMSALIILPKEGININDYINKSNINDSNMKKIINNLMKVKLNLELPKFELEFYDSLIGILKNMGIKIAFTESADFTGLRKGNDLYIGQVLHKTYLKVNEEGTEATGATVVEIVTKSISINKVEMKVNRPFIFMIRNSQLPAGNDMIFMAKIEEIK